MRLTRHTALSTTICILLLMVTSITVYWPGSSGDFMLDDSHNLAPLEQMNGDVTAESLRQFVFSGNSSVFGRPISLLSFTLDAQTWPAEPYSFKRSNILIHTFNTLLLFGVLYTLFRLINRQWLEALTISFTAAMIWAIHPLQTSTVLYVIQRMAELSAFFILIALWCYLHGRSELDQNPGAAYWWMTCALVIGGILAFFSKETGILLPLFVLILEFTLLAKLPRPQHWRYWAAPVLGVPIAVILVYFGYIISDAEARFAIRDFSLYERLLTEPRILFDYLYKFALPLQTPTIYNDTFTISKGVFDPVSTLFAIAAMFGLIGIAIAWRKRQPVLSFAILWFFGAHLLESSVLPLELYFEHRNYIALIGPAVALGDYAWRLISTKPRPFSAIPVAIVLALGIATFNYSQTWGDQTALVKSWVDEAPDSKRAQLHYTNELYRSGKIETALALAEQNLNAQPNHIASNLNYATMACANNSMKRDQYSTLLENAATTKPDASTLATLNILFNEIRSGSCKQIPYPGLERIVDALLQNPELSGDYSRAYLYRLKSEINFYLRRFEPTSQALQAAFEIEPNFDTAVRLAYLYVGGRNPGLAEHYLKTAEMLDDRRNPLLPSQQEKLSQLRQTIQDLSAASRARN